MFSLFSKTYDSTSTQTQVCKISTWIKNVNQLNAKQHYGSKFLVFKENDVAKFIEEMLLGLPISKVH